MKNILTFAAALFAASFLFSCRPHVLCPAYSSNSFGHKTEKVAVVKKTTGQKSLEKVG